jgi:perosamine synthetase
LDTGWISAAGEYVNKFEKAIQNYTGAKYAIACMNGTVGLQGRRLGKLEKKNMMI